MFIKLLKSQVRWGMESRVWKVGSQIVPTPRRKVNNSAYFGILMDCMGLVLRNLLTLHCIKNASDEDNAMRKKQC